MKTRLAALISIALLAAACGPGEAAPSNGLSRTTTSAGPTTTNPGGETPIEGPLPTDPNGPAGTNDPANSPEVSIVPIEVEPCDAPTEELEAYCQPFELVLGNTTIVWDRWFWGQGTFSKGSVEVYHGDVLVAAGPFVGEESIVEQDEDDNFIFFDSTGAVVAIASPADITPAIQAALDGLNG